MKEIPPVEVSISVSLGVAEAFSLFTDGIGTWWPMQTHSVGGRPSGRRRNRGARGWRVV